MEYLVPYSSMGSPGLNLQFREFKLEHNGQSVSLEPR